MTEIPNIPISTIMRARGELVFSAKLYQCRPFYATVLPRDLGRFMSAGKKVATMINPRLAGRCLKDQDAFYHLREQTRGTIVAIINDETPRPPELAHDPITLHLAAVFWLALHEPEKGHVVRYSAARCLNDGGRAIIEVACNHYLAYVTTVGVNPRTDLPRLLARAAQARVSHAVMEEVDGPTLH